MIKPLALALVLAGGLSCGDKGTEPTPIQPVDTPGKAVVALTTPNTDDGAVVVTLRGPALSTIVASSAAYVVYSRLVSATEAKVIVVGDVTAGPLFTVQVGAANRLSAYTTSVEQVAARNDALRVGTAGYQVTFSAGP